MKKLALYTFVLVLLSASFALASEGERDLSPEAGTGWLVATLEGIEYEWTYTGMVAGIAEATFTFEGEAGPLHLKLNKALTVGEEMSPNGIKTADFTSEVTTSRGYYSVSKTMKEDVDCTVLMEKIDDSGIWQGTFSLTVNPTDRTVADVRPGILQTLTFENGAFCFNP